MDSWRLDRGYYLERTGNERPRRPLRRPKPPQFVRPNRTAESVLLPRHVQRPVMGLTGRAAKFGVTQRGFTNRLHRFLLQVHRHELLVTPVFALDAPDSVQRVGRLGICRSGLWKIRDL